MHADESRAHALNAAVSFTSAYTSPTPATMDDVARRKDATLRLADEFFKYIQDGVKPCSSTPS